MKHPRLLCCQALKSLLHFLPEHLMTDTISRILFCLIFEKVPKMMIFFLMHNATQTLIGKYRFRNGRPSYAVLSQANRSDK